MSLKAVTWPELPLMAVQYYSHVSRLYYVTSILHCHWWKFWSRDMDIKLILAIISIKNQCLGSGSCEFARFWLPGSGSAKICGSTDPDPMGKISTKNCINKKNFISKPKSELLKKRDYKNFLISEWFIKF